MKSYFTFILLLIFGASACTSTAQPEQKAEAVTENTTPAPETKPAPAMEKAFNDINVAEFKELMDDENVILLDVRTPAEVANGIIGAPVVLDIRGNPTQFKEGIKELDKNKSYLVYCRSGNRSVHACNAMAAIGFKSLYNLKGGIIAWDRDNQKQ